MKRISEYKNRFNQLMESTMGNVKTLIKEEPIIKVYSNEVKRWLDNCVGKVYYNSVKIDDNGYVTIVGDFDCSEQSLTNLKGVTFKEVTGNFNCGGNGITSLVGCPETVGGTFNCSKNEITSLDGSPKTVGKNYLIHDNPKEFTIDEIKAVTSVAGDITVKI
jgi:hypothetical protein